MGILGLKIGIWGVWEGGLSGGGISKGGISERGYMRGLWGGPISRNKRATGRSWLI